MEIPKNLPKIQNVSVIKSTKPQFFELALLIIVIGLFYWFIVMPKKAEIATKTDQQAVLQKEKDSGAKDLADFNALIAKLNSSPQAIEHLDEALPLQGKSFEFSMLINKLAQDSGVTVGDVNVSAPGNDVIAGNTELLKNPYGVKRSLKTLTGSISALGTYQQLQAFLQKLETSGRIINITGMDLAGSTEDQLNMKLNIESYYFTP